MKTLGFAVLVVAAVFAINAIGALLLVGPAWLAQTVLGPLVRCCGQEVAVPVTLLAFIGPIAAMWYGAVKFSDWRWKRSIHRR